MKISHLPLKIVFGLLFVLTSMASHAQGRKVGYMPYWAGDANTIQYDKLTHINYSFALPQSNGSISAVDNPAKLQTIVSRAHAVGCKVLIAIGGWSNQGSILDPTFETLASNASSRTRFVNDALYIVNQYGLDGVDIDWEYPDAGASANNFEALITELSNALKPTGKLLSAAVIGNGGQGAGVSLGALNKLDHLNVMSYDANNYDHSTYNYAIDCLNYWSGRGLAKNKIVLGVPFYGRPSWSSFATLVSQGADPNGDIFNGNGYNGKTTIANKATYVKNNGYGGIMIWELSQDAAGANSLLTVIHNTLGTTIVNPPVQGAYQGTITSLPGRLEAERYDVGGQGVAFSDNTAGNSGNNFRTDDVDVEACTEGGSNVGYIADGEWLEYTVNFTSAGLYKLDVRVASTTAGTSLTIEIPGSATSTVNVPNTGGWQTWQTVTLNNVNVTAGQKIVRLNFKGGMNINYVDFSKGITPPPTGPLVVYQNCNNDPGYVIGLQAGTYTTAQLNALGIANNDVSRIDVQSGYEVTLYNNDNLDASAGSFSSTSNVACLSTFNDMATSIKVALVTITGGNNAPTIALTAPANGSSANAPASITVSANASDADGTVSKVDFYNGSTLLFSDNAAPYTYTWTNVGAGSYSFTAKVTDNAGATATSSTATVTINAVVSGGGCAGVAQYAEGSGYVAGSKVKNAGNQYACKPYPFSGWCNGAAWAYGPGTGAYWSDAWTLVGSCGTARATTEGTAVVNEALVSNAPNPFSNSTTIEVVTVDAGDVSVKVYNKAGQLIQVIAEGSLNAGTHEFVFDASGLIADMYIVKCNTPNGVITRKIMKVE
jgi:chitinase